MGPFNRRCQWHCTKGAPARARLGGAGRTRAQTKYYAATPHQGKYELYSVCLQYSSNELPAVAHAGHVKVSKRGRKQILGGAQDACRVTASKGAFARSTAPRLGHRHRSRGASQGRAVYTCRLSIVRIRSGRRGTDGSRRRMPRESCQALERRSGAPSAARRGVTASAIGGSGGPRDNPRQCRLRLAHDAGACVGSVGPRGSQRLRGQALDSARRG